MKYKTIYLLIFIFNLNFVSAGINFENYKSNIKFSVTAQKISELKYIIRFNGLTKNNFHAYSIRNKNKETSPRIYFDELNNIKIIETTESSPQYLEDSFFQEGLWVHKNNFYIQKELYLKEKRMFLTGKIRLQICDQRICSLPLEYPFRVILEEN